MSAETAKNVLATQKNGYNSAKTMHDQEKERQLLLAFRQGLIFFVGTIEDYLGMPRSFVSKRDRARADSHREISGD